MDENFLKCCFWQLKRDAAPGVDEVEISRVYVPTIENWEAGGSSLTAVPGEVPLTVTYRGNPSFTQDPCQHLSHTINLTGTATDEPLRVETISGTEMEVWDLYHVNLKYDYIHYTGCLRPANVCASPRCTRDPLSGDRFLDFYVSISTPTGAIIEPSGSRCL